MQASLPNLQNGDGDPILKKVAQFNDCMRACRRMLGKPCFAMGRSHLDACQEALEKIELELCGGQKGVVWLRNLLLHSFPGISVSDAFLYWPMILGGIGLEDPHAELRHSLRAFETSTNWMTAPAKPRMKGCMTALQQPAAQLQPQQPQGVGAWGLEQQQPMVSVPPFSSQSVSGYPLMHVQSSYPVHPSEPMGPIVGLTHSTMSPEDAKLKRWEAAMRRWLSVATKPA